MGILQEQDCRRSLTGTRIHFTLWRRRTRSNRVVLRMSCIFRGYRSWCHAILSIQISSETGWPTDTTPWSDVVVNPLWLDIGFVSQCPHAQTKVVKDPHISRCFTVFGVGCSVVLFVVFSKVIEGVLIYSKYHSQIWLKLLVRTSESCDVMFRWKHTANSPKDGISWLVKSAAFHRRLKFSLRIVWKQSGAVWKMHAWWPFLLTMNWKVAN